MHGDPIAAVLFALMVVILAAKIGGTIAQRFGQPAVLGELVIGVVLGNLHLAGVDGLDFLFVDYTTGLTIRLDDATHLAGVTVDHLARLGVILLLFQVGLESSVAQLKRVGSSALLVAVIGVVVPLGLGWLSGLLLLPDHHWAVHMFLGATLSATSVGITARTLQDLEQSKSDEAQIILGAAVIDDVLGLVILAVVQGVIAALAAQAAGQAVHFGTGELLIVLVKAVGFLGVALLLGQYISRYLFKFASFLRGTGLLIATSLLLCFGFSLLANTVGLAAIVGAFAAGLVLEDVHYRDMFDEERTGSVQHLMHPISDLLVPIFFVIMGVHVDMRSLSDPNVLSLAVVLIVVAVAGKQACSLGVLMPRASKLAVGIGMIPRGEVGLIFAAVGLQLKVGSERILDEGTYSAIVLMVVATTMVTPPLLKYAFARKAGLEAADPDSEDAVERALKASSSDDVRTEG